MPLPFRLGDCELISSGGRLPHASLTPYFPRWPLREISGASRLPWLRSQSIVMADSGVNGTWLLEGNANGKLAPDAEARVIFSVMEWNELAWSVLASVDLP